MKMKKQYQKAVSKISFPVTDISSALFKNLASPRVGVDHGLGNPFTDENINEYLFEILEVRAMVTEDKYPIEFLKKYYPYKDINNITYELPQPLHMAGLDASAPKRLAQAVHMDSPIDLGLAMLHFANQHGAPKVAEINQIDFLAHFPGTIKALGIAIDDAINRAFEAKYFFGVVRPEEIVGYNMTAYPEGCPPHPSFPAGHGAAAGAVGAYFRQEWDLPEDKLQDILDSCYLWAMFRSLAGVHYAPDNLAGLNIGGLTEIEYGKA